MTIDNQQWIKMHVYVIELASNSNFTDLWIYWDGCDNWKDQWHYSTISSVVNFGNLVEE